MVDTFDVIAIGDTTEDIFLQMTDASLQCDIDGKNCRLCFDYAEKIGVDQKTVVPAVGNAANHAVGTARLGLRAALYTIVGDDDDGHKAKSILAANNVDTQYVVFDSEHGTNLSVVINFKTERTIFVYHEPREYALPALAPTQWIYLTSASGGGVAALHQQVEQYLAQNPDVKLAFNPGTYQIKLGLDGLMPLLKRTELLFLNREESARVLGVETTDVKELIKKFHEIGVKYMVLTDGPAGSYASDGTTIWQQAIYPEPVVERTGAGDAYGSGVLSALVKGVPMPDAMSWGNANATSVVGYIGAREGLLQEETLQKLMAQHPNIQPQVFAQL